MCFTTQVSIDWITKEVVCYLIGQVRVYVVVIHLIPRESYHFLIFELCDVALRDEWPHAVVYAYFDL